MVFELSRKQIFCVALASALLIASGLVIPTGVLASDSPAASPELLTIFAKMRSQLRRIMSIQYRSTEACTEFKDGRISKKTRSTMNCAIKNEKFHVDLRIEDSQGKPLLHDVVAFNGRHYQMFVPGVKSLEWASRQPRSPFLQPIPLMQSYMFVYAEDDRLDFAGMLKARRWEELARQTTLKGQKTIRGHKCDVLSIKRTFEGQKVECTVYAATDLHHLPLEFVSHSPRHYVRMSVTSFRRITSDDGMLVIPTGIESDARYEADKLRTMCITTIDPATLRVNHDIPEELFTISKERATLLINGDTGEVIDRRVHPAQVAPTNKTNDQWPYWLLVVNAAFLGVLILILGIRRRRRAVKH